MIRLASAETNGCASCGTKRDETGKTIERDLTELRFERGNTSQSISLCSGCLIELRKKIEPLTRLG